MTAQPRFAVVYRWRVVPAKEEQFQRAWEVLTREFAHEGSLGSRLHRASDGSWLAYAQWPSREMWEAAEIRTASGKAALEQMTDAVEQRLEPILLEPVADYLAETVMTTHGDVVVVDAEASAQQLARAAEILAARSGVIVLAGVATLRATRTELLCEVTDPMPSSHRCAYEYEVLVENARRALEASRLQGLLPDLPCRWSVVEQCGSGTRELWPMGDQ